MNKLDAIFRRLRAEHRKALIPFVVAGDPSLEATRELLRALPAAGVEIAEVGFPYSDPIADGPTIQAAYTRALAGGISVEQVFHAVAPVAQTAALGIVGMVSFALVYRQGVDRWVARAAEAGLAGLIVPDLPSEEAAELHACCRARQLALVPLIAPTTDLERAKRIVEQASGFLYYVSIAGVTGERSTLPPDIADRLQSLRALTELPICVGFGVRDEAQVRALAPLVDGVIVGSALVRRLATATEQRAATADLVAEIAALCRQLSHALQPSARPSAAPH